jgi:predicted RNase H-like HicB family nuclease
MKKKPRDFHVVIERDEDGWLVASVPQLPGCHTQAKTYDTLMKRIREAIEACLGGCDHVPVQIEFEWRALSQNRCHLNNSDPGAGMAAMNCASFGHRSRAKQNGWGSDRDIVGKPVIGILNTWSDLNSCHMHGRDELRAIAHGRSRTGADRGR